MRAAELLAQADALVIAAGAGMGVDSGLPDFRGNQGFWQAYPALGRARLDFTRVASPHTFATSPSLAWGFYGHRLALYRRTVPHEGFATLQRLGQGLAMGSFVFTSNVDGQFQCAGWADGRVAECHGSIHWLQCTRPCSGAIWPATALMPDIDEDACHWRGSLPTCPHCGALARPNILMFGDGDWLPARTAAQEDRLAAWLASTRHPLVLELGAGTHVPSVRHFSQQVLHQHGGRLVRINPREPEVHSTADVGLAMGALDGLRALEAALASLG